jgi:hypothetical protein
MSSVERGPANLIRCVTVDDHLVGAAGVGILADQDWPRGRSWCAHRPGIGRGRAAAVGARPGRAPGLGGLPARESRRSRDGAVRRGTARTTPPNSCPGGWSAAWGRAGAPLDPVSRHRRSPAIARGHRQRGRQHEPAGRHGARGEHGRGRARHPDRLRRGPLGVRARIGGRWSRSTPWPRWSRRE